ncbi:hypothetical protein [uncultured Sphingomonas sp.]|uniref:hypothetical protein n=1 Tax=uncultured Sphingomonas sp. TaxID=158754 RepID=UPI0035CB6A70
MQSALDDEVDGNFDAFYAILPQLLQKHIGQFALLRHRALEGCLSIFVQPSRRGRRASPINFFLFKK